MRAVSFFSCYCLFASILAQQAQAAVTLTVDLDTQTPGVQSVLNVMQGDVLRVGVMVDIGPIDGDNGINSYRFGVAFLGLELGPNDLTDFDEMLNPFPTNVLRTPPFQSIPVPPFVRSFSNLGDLDLAQPGTVQNIAAGSTSFTIDEGFSQRVFEFTLRANTPTTDGPFQVAATIGMNDGFVVSDNTVDPPVDMFVPVTLVPGSVNVAAVPEPSSLGMIGLAALYVGHRKRKARKKRENVL